MEEFLRISIKLVAGSHKSGVYILRAKRKLGVNLSMSAKKESLENIVFSRLSCSWWR
jgi:hypothetical protein